MTITPEQREELAKVCQPVMDWLVKNCHPHTAVTVDSFRAELVEGIASVHRGEEVEKP